ncbi:DinB family protein [Chitinophaga pinensis]|uniref:DinB family protein n=1 Tax=Chitinophaga pinensis TaxID=79329 RepID=A0A5C6LL62_9BACT|nr:DinB family protein [Chitinophaga pinensis]TWV94727.1 DinB family protein [Chitinophaga pinensis]
MDTNLETNYTGQIISQVLRNWDNEVAHVNRMFNKYPDEIYMQQVAPGRNSAWYILGHLAATTDAMLPQSFAGELIYPDIAPFLYTSEKTLSVKANIQYLRRCWVDITNHFSKETRRFSSSEWMQRHALTSQEDFARDPGRNRLNLLMSRTAHLRYHLGQIALLTPTNAGI